MPVVTTKFVGDTLFRVIPDGGTPVVWSTLLTEAETLGFGELVKRFAFGAPESISRTGNKFTARGKAPASTTEYGITVHSKQEVNFEIAYSEAKLDVTNIVGVRVKPPLFNEFSLTHVTFTTDDAGSFYVSTKAYGWVPIKKKISEAGITD